MSQTMTELKQAAEEWLAAREELLAQDGPADVRVNPDFSKSLGRLANAEMVLAAAIRKPERTE